jgi:hypothetical protein
MSETKKRREIGKERVERKGRKAEGDKRGIRTKLVGRLTGIECVMLCV